MVKKIIFKFLPLISATSMIAIPLASCASSNRKNNNVNIDDNAGDGTNNIDTFKKGKLAPEIEKVYNQKNNITSIDVSKDNSIDVYKSVGEVLTNDINSNNELEKINNVNLSQDVYSYLYSLYVSNRSFFSFYLIGEQTFDVDESKNVTIKVSLKIVNENSKTSSFIIDENSYELKQNDFIILDISIDNLKPNLTINKYNDRYFLGLQFETVNLTITNNVNKIDDNNKNNDSIVFNNFSFTSKTYSNIFLIEYNHVTSTLDYNSAMKNSQVIENYNNLTNDAIGKEVSQQIDIVQSYIQKIISLTGTIIDSVAKDQTIDQFISFSASSVIDLLVEAKIIPNNKTLIDAVKKLLNTNQSVLDTIANNKELVVGVITHFVGSDFFVENLIRAFVDKIKPSMNDSEKTELKKQFKDLISTLGINNIEFLDGIIDSLFSGSTIVEFLHTILKNDTVIKMITTSVGDKYKDIVALLQKIFTNDNKSKTVLQIIVDNKSSITTILSSLINDTTLSGVLNVMITDNTNFTYDNVKKIFTTILQPIADQFLNYSTKEGKQTKIDYNKETKKLSYSYQYTYTFNKDLKVDLTPLKNIVPDVIDLQKMGINTKEIEDMVANNKSNFNKYIILNTNSGKEWYKFNKNDIIKQLPNSVTIKTNDKLVFDYNITNQDLWLNPTKVDGDKWAFGYQIPYVADIYLDAPGMFKSISDDFNNQTLNKSGSKIWDTVASKYVQMLAKVYNFTGMLYISKNENILDNFDYSDKLYMKDYSFEFNEEKISKENFDKAISYFKNTEKGSYNDLSTKITRYKTEVSDQNAMNQLLIKDYSSLNLVKTNNIFTFSQMTTIKSEKDSNGQDVNALQFWLPLNVRQGAIWYSDEVLDLYINININSFTSTSFTPFKIIDKNNNWVNSFTTNAFSIDVTASSVITFLFIKFPVSFPIINLYKN